MEDQITNIITILTALLTGGFLMLFIENQQITTYVIERLHQRMNPFFHSFTNYVKFVSSFESCFSWKKCTTSNMKSMKQCIEDISKYGGKAVISGQDFSIYSFSATELDSICEKINGIWYYEDTNISDFNDNVSFDENHAKNFGEYSLEYLRGISPKYNHERLTKSLLPKVSGDFYADIYQPIQNVLYEYEYWMKKEKYFKNLAFVTISGNILFMLVILMFHQYLPICIAYLLCIICSGLLIYELYELMRIEKLAKEIMR